MSHLNPVLIDLESPSAGPFGPDPERPVTESVAFPMSAVHLATDLGGEITVVAESARAAALDAAGRRPAALASASVAVEGATDAGDTWRKAGCVRERVVSGALGSR